MTITKIAERPRRSGTVSKFGLEDTEQRVFICSSDSADISGADLATAVGLPRKWDRHPKDPRLFMLNMSYTQETKGPKYLEVICDYKTLDGETEEPPKGSQESPVSLKPEITWDGTTYQRAANGSRKAISQAPEKEKVSEGIVNSAGEVYDPPFEIDEEYPTVHVKRAERVWNIYWLMSYAGSINVDDFVIDGQFVPKLTARVQSVRIGKQERDPLNLPYRWVEYTVIINSDTWLLQPLDYGTYYLDADGNEVPFTVKGHLKVGKLNGAGAKLLAGDPDVFLKFHVRRELEFRKLNLPIVSV